MIAFVALQAVAVPFLIVLVIFAIVAIAIFARVFGEAVSGTQTARAGRRKKSANAGTSELRSL